MHDESSEVQNLSELFSAITRAGQFGLQVLASPDASELAKADASAVVDQTTRKLNELLQAFDEDEED